jgi:hypothetical protein
MGEGLMSLSYTIFLILLGVGIVLFILLVAGISIAYRKIQSPSGSREGNEGKKRDSNADESRGETDDPGATHQNDGEKTAELDKETENSQTSERKNIEDEPPSRNTLIKELQRLDSETEGYPLTSRMREAGEFTPNQYYEEFGNWEDALEAAGIDKRQHLLDDIRSVAEVVGTRPTTTDMDRHGIHSSGVHTTYFDSWDAAVEAAGVAEPNPSDPEENSIDEKPVSDSNKQCPDEPKSPLATTSEGFEGESNDESMNEGAPSTGGNRKETTTSSSTRVAESPQTEGDNQVSERAFAKIAEISEERRLNTPIAVKILSISGTRGGRKEASLLVEDVDGTECRLNVWRKHDIDIPWKQGHWYTLEQVRGKHWTNRSGATRRQLSSTKDMRADHVGTTPPEPGTQVEPNRDSSETGTGTREATEEADTPARDETGKADNEEDSPESEDILDDVMSEFKELS